MNLLVPYVRLYDHPDPLLNEFTYGDSTKDRARKLTKLKENDHVFFHTSINGRKYITAYYVVDRVLTTSEAAQDKNIAAKYQNPHILEFLSGKRTDNNDDVVLFGDPITSRILRKPLLFDKTLTEQLSLNIKFPNGRTETQIIGSATRSWRELKDKDVEVLKEAIRLWEKVEISAETILSTDEITEIIERDLEGFIENDPTSIGHNLKLVRRQLDTPVGRIDLLFEDTKGNMIVVELKLDKIGRGAVSQLRRYMNWVEKEAKKEVAGVIVCKGVMPAFREDFEKLKNIEILCYGWQLKVYPWRESN